MRTIIVAAAAVFASTAFAFELWVESEASTETVEVCTMLNHLHGQNVHIARACAQWNDDENICYIIYPHGNVEALSTLLAQCMQWSVNPPVEVSRRIANIL